MYGEMNPLAVLISWGTGLAVKHLVKSKKLNKTIPFINMASNIAFHKVMGLDWMTSVVAGLQSSGTATITHTAAKEVTPKITGGRKI